MKQPSTIFLRLVIVGLALLAVMAIILLIPGLINPNNYDYLPLVIVAYTAAIPFFVALWQALSLLKLIDTNQAFSALSVTALQRIKYAAITISGLYGISLPYWFVLAQEEDAPGLMVIGLMATTGPIVIAVFAALLQKLLHSAITLKSENDLTI